MQGVLGLDQGLDGPGNRREYIGGRYSERRYSGRRCIRDAGRRTATIDKHLPLTEPTYYILLALTEPLHGYAIMQEVEQLSGGAVSVGPGTLYGALSTLEGDGLIVKVAEAERRKSYALTALGRRVLLSQIARLQVMAKRGGEVAGRLKATGTK